eukprot:CAMPEP_0203823958 /NCGR_PEP_ID=MMETSP0115-20131106/50500_1 /ASSEMBLY_ACC=CAM_ASM_000227 /TAXON_ID=33651 /ORGANISM="Bicosoecid sp, Strain ms1" /LENGTH=33 /DNA_ID= /DNA_START= /DNA_END= /DNA_ORIENTATION=
MAGVAQASWKADIARSEEAAAAAEARRDRFRRA